MGHSTGVTSAVFFAGLLAGAALAGPAGALSVVCYHRKKKQAKTRGKWVAVDLCHLLSVFMTLVFVQGWYNE